MSGMPFALPQRVLVRELSASFADCLRMEAGERIDVEKARRQHAGYVAALRALGLAVDVLPADDACADCCFIEDTAVLTGSHAVLTCPGASARRAEVPPIGEALARDAVVHTMASPATLDGGDVLRAGTRLFVGLSSRTNAAGVAFLREVAARDGLLVVALEVRGGLHLKSACTLAGASLLVYDASLIHDDELSQFRVAGLECIAAEEPLGANVLAIGDAVLVSAAAPRTAARLAAAGRDVRMVDVGEMHKGDGALTCLSLRVPARGAWCT